MEDFFSQYFSYTENTEIPKIYHRWSVIATVGALLGRRFFLNHGHSTIYPNIYCILVGSSGSRKSAAIKLIKKLVYASGYDTIAAEKSSKEKFLLDLENSNIDENTSVDDILDKNLFCDDTQQQDKEVFIMADEFNDFFGNGNIEFFSLLGTLWDFEGNYRYRLKNSKSVNIFNPTVSLLGGNTPVGLSLTFPSEIFGQGFFSRLILVYGVRRDVRIPFPKNPDPKHTQEIIESLQRFRALHGNAEFTSSATNLAERIYTSDSTGIRDPRFESYATRRFTHLLKIAIICAAIKYQTIIDEHTLITANTILTCTEQLMTKTLGEFGKAKNSDTSHKVLQIIETNPGISTFKDLWISVCSDLEKPSDLALIIQNLMMADKLQIVPGGKGYLPKRKLIEVEDSSILDYSILHEEERNMLI